MALTLRILVTLAGIVFGGGDDDIGPLKLLLHSDSKWERKEGVEKLARLGAPEAWEQVLRALGDPKGEVADTAQFLLGRIGEAETAELLEGELGLRAGDPWVRLRAAEVFGRLVLPVDGERLAKRLSDRDPAVRRMLLWSVERAARRDVLELGRGTRVLEAVERASARDRDPGVRARGLFALVALEGAERRLRGALRERAPEVRCAALAVAPEVLGPGPALEVVAPAAEDDDLRVRTQAVDSLAAIATPAACARLVRVLEDEEEVRLRGRALDVLRGLSGLKHRHDPRPWRDWVASLPAGWRGTLSLSPSTPEPGGGGSAVFAGLPIRSGRLAFLIDLSGSIWVVRADGRSRKERVDEELARALAALPEDALFNVIPYTGEPHPWKEELVRATPSNVRKATAAFAACDERGTGNFWDAALVAMADPAVDTLVVLTDGAPTGGRRYRLELLVELFCEANATRKVAVDSVLVGASGRARDAWTRLSARTGGRSIAIELGPE